MSCCCSRRLGCSVPGSQLWLWPSHEGSNKLWHHVRRDRDDALATALVPAQTAAESEPAQSTVCDNGLQGSSPRAVCLVVVACPAPDAS